MRKITADTMIPLSFILVVSGAMLWLSTMHAEISQATAEVSSLSITQKNIDRRLANIEGKLDILLKGQK